MLIKCPSTNKVEGFSYEDVSDTERNYFAISASEDVIFRGHHRRASIAMSAANYSLVCKVQTLVLCGLHATNFSALTGMPLILSANFT